MGGRIHLREEKGHPGSTCRGRRKERICAGIGGSGIGIRMLNPCVMSSALSGKHYEKPSGEGDKLHTSGEQACFEMSL